MRIFQSKNLRFEVGNSFPRGDTRCLKISDLCLGSTELVLKSEIHEVLATELRVKALNVPRLGFDDGVTQEVGSSKTLMEAGLERSVFSLWIG